MQDLAVPADPGEIMPVLGLVERVILPGSRCCVLLTTVAAYGAVREATRTRAAPELGVFSAARDGGPDPLASVGVLARVVDLENRRGLWVAELQATGRIRKRELLRTHPFRLAPIERCPGTAEEGDALRALALAVHLAAARPRPDHCLVARIRQQLRTAASWELPGLVMPLIEDIPWTEWQAVLEADALEDQLAFVLARL
jgi:Lon protease-like protein